MDIHNSEAWKIHIRKRVVRKTVIFSGILVFLCISMAMAQIHEPPLPSNQINNGKHG